MRASSSFPSRRLGQSIFWVVFYSMTAISTALTGGCAAEDATLSGTQPAERSASPTTPSAGEQGEKSKAPAGAPAVPRKIIYDARVDLVVDSLSTTEQAVLDLIKEYNGFLAESDQASVTSNQRRATWRVRVPADHFNTFLAAVCRLGEVKQNHLGSQDVTEEYFDVEARIRNKQEEEKRLLKHLSDSTGKLEDILAVERELSRVRGEVEQMQGRLRFLANRTELSTITIDATEWKDYKPPIAPTFPTQIARTFFNSLDNLFAFGKAMAMVAVALLPWLPLMLAGLFVLRWLFRANRRSSQPKLRPVTPAQPTTT
jgi:Domain of unknown function (DUF4349)